MCVRVCVYVCVFVCVRKRERYIDKQSDRDRDRKIKFVLARQRKQHVDGGKRKTMSFLRSLSSPPSTIRWLHAIHSELTTTSFKQTTADV